MTRRPLSAEDTAKRLDGSLGTVTRSIRQYLDDPSVIEIMLNPDGRVWIDRLRQGQSSTETTIDPEEAEGLLRFVATESGATLNRDHLSLAGKLPHWSARVQGWMPPLVERPTFTIRKPPAVVFSLDEYVERGVLSESQRDAVLTAVLQRKNLLVGGGTGTGKTTFLNAVLRAMAEHTKDRLYIAEDTPELQCSAPNVVLVRTIRGKYELRDAVFDALRARPDRIIVGEIRDGTAVDVIKAWNTGHPGGAATIHANDTSGMLDRMCQLYEERVHPAPREFIGEAVDVCIHLTLDAKAPSGRRLSGLDAVRGYDAATRRWLLEAIA